MRRFSGGGRGTFVIPPGAGAGASATLAGHVEAVAMHGVPEAIHARGDDGRSAETASPAAPGHDRGRDPPAPRSRPATRPADPVRRAYEHDLIPIAQELHRLTLTDAQPLLPEALREAREHSDSCRGRPRGSHRPCRVLAPRHLARGAREVAPRSRVLQAGGQEDGYYIRSWNRRSRPSHPYDYMPLRPSQISSRRPLARSTLYGSILRQ